MNTATPTIGVEATALGGRAYLQCGANSHGLTVARGDLWRTAANESGSAVKTQGSAHPPSHA